MSTFNGSNLFICLVATKKSSKVWVPYLSPHSGAKSSEIILLICSSTLDLSRPFPSSIKASFCSLSLSLQPEKPHSLLRNQKITLWNFHHPSSELELDNKARSPSLVQKMVKPENPRLMPWWILQPVAVSLDFCSAFSIDEVA